MPTAIELRVIGVLLIVIALVGAGWYVNGLRWQHKYDALQSQMSQFQENVAAAGAKAQVDAAAREKLATDQLAEQQQDYERKLQDDQATIDQLRAAVASGAQRLYVRAACPGSGGLSSDASAAQGAHGATAELNTDARQDYFALRSAFSAIEQQVIGLQRYARQCMLLTTQAQ